MPAEPVSGEERSNHTQAASAVSPRLWVGIVVAIPPTAFLWWLLLFGVWNPHQDALASRVALQLPGSNVSKVGTAAVRRIAVFVGVRTSGGSEVIEREDVWL